MIEDVLKYKRLDGVGRRFGPSPTTFAGGRQAHVFTDRIDRIKVPVQAIWGAEEDRIVPSSHASVIPEGHRHVFGGAGHMVHMEKAGEVNRLISDFLTTR